MASESLSSRSSDFLRRSVMQLWPKVFAYGVSLVRDRHWAEDLCQETYLRFFEMRRPVDSIWLEAQPPVFPIWAKTSQKPTSSWFTVT